MNSITAKVYSKMFPQNMNDFPSFESIDTSDLFVKKEIEDCLINFVIDSAIDLDRIEINDFLKRFKRLCHIFANEFIDDAIRFYFSHPQVLSVIQNGRTTLFPHSRVLPDIDYDLLIPVFEKE